MQRCGLGFLSILAAAALLGACGDDSASKIPEASRFERREKPLHERDWLTRLTKVEPHRWLASHQAGHPLQDGDKRIAEMQRQLATAATRFDETPRMIANRAVQLEGMLREIGIRETPAQLINDLLSTTAGSEHKQSFGTLVQHYFNLRRLGQTKKAALTSLRHTIGGNADKSKR